MKILISIGHPAQYHFFKHTMRQLEADGHQVKVVIKTKDILERLLQEDGVPYVNVQTSVRHNDKFSILCASLRRSWAVWRIACQFKPDILLGTGADVAHAGWLMRKPCITTLEDDVDIIVNLARMAFPFTTHLLVPIPCRVGHWEKKKIGYAGYMKMAYLHPNRFVPDRRILTQYSITGKYILLRMVRLTAYHDTGVKGLSIRTAEEIIRMAEAHGYRVYISAESSLDNRLQPHQLHIRPKDIHHVMAFASLLISDSQSMSVEAALLGVPNIRFSSFAGRISVLEELEQSYALTRGIPADDEAHLLTDVGALLANPELKDSCQQRRVRMLQDKIDVTTFLTWFIESYPESREIMKRNPDYQYRFR